MTAPPPLRVMARPAWSNRLQNPYNARINERLPEHGVHVVEYDPLRAPFVPADIVHVHWPESSFNHGLLGARITTESLLAVLRLQRRRGARVVWTAHNLRAHERRYARSEEAFWGRYLPLVDGIVALGPSSLTRLRENRPELADRPTFVIPHPHYRGEYPDHIDRRAARAALGLPFSRPVLAFFGHIKAYKNVPAFIESGLRLPGAHLVVAGLPRDRALAAEVRRAAGHSSRVHLTLRYIGSEDTQLYLRAADLLVLPYRDILNSGTALLGLSFDRPVWLPAGPLAEELHRMIPGSWVHSGRLDPRALSDALEGIQSLPERTEGEHLAPFEPAHVARLHAEAYLALGRRRQDRGEADT